MNLLARRRARVAVAATVAALALGACGAKVESPAGGSAETVTINNCGLTQTYPRPSRAVAYDVSAIDKMFALGLRDRMAGIVLPHTVRGAATLSPYAADYAKTTLLGEDVLNTETLVKAKADWVFAGWQAGFSEERGVTPQSLQGLGMHAFMQNETCSTFGDRSVDIPDPFEAMWADFAQLGKIFGVEQKAQQVTDELKARAARLEQAPKPKRPAKVLVYDSGTGEVYTAGRRTGPSKIIQLAGAQSVTDDLDARWTQVGWESIVKADPDVILVVDYDKQPAADKINYLKTQSPVKDSEAVRHDRIRLLPYHQAVTGPATLDAAEDLATWLRGQGL